MGREKAGEGRALALGGLVLAVLTAFVVTQLRVTTDITHFLPGGEADAELLLARELAAGELARTMVLLVTVPDEGGAAPDPAHVAQVSRDFEAALRAEPRVDDALQFLDGGPPDGVEEALWTLYQPRRFGFVADTQAGAESAITDEALAASVEDLKRRLGLPISGLLSRVAPADPLLVLPKMFERLAAGRGEGLGVVNGRFVADDGRSAVVFAGTAASASDSSAQRPFLAGVRAAFDQLNERHGNTLTMQQSGANRFAVRAEEVIQADIQRVSIGTTLVLTLGFLWLFRSLRLALLAVPVLGAGFLVGTTACILLFGEVHGLTLAFGAALMGVGVDYAVHFHCHHTLAPDPAGPRHTLRALWPGLALGAATTVMGFVALLVSTFPGLRELAVFAACGITASLVAAWVFLPGLAGPSRSTVAALRVGAAVRRTLGATTGRRRALLAVPAVVVVVVAALGLPRAQWNDNIADLNRLDPVLLREDEAVRSKVVRFEQRRLVVAAAATEEAALQINDRAARVLDGAQRDGLVEGYRSVATLLPSAKLQRDVDQVLRGDGTLWPRMEQALQQAGFVADKFGAFAEALAGPAPEPLQWQDLAGTPMASMVRPFRVTLDAPLEVADAPRFGFVSFVHGLNDADGLAARLAAEGVRLLDIQGVLTGAYASYRQRMAQLLMVGLLAILGLVALRHIAAGLRAGRGLGVHDAGAHGVGAWWRPTVAACAPALLGAAGTVAVLGLMGVALNILSLVALLMVVSMGVDYGVFLAEGRHGEADAERSLDATHLAVVVAGVTTTLGFGLLAWSDQPALLSIGLTSGIGVLLCLLLAPTMRALLLGRHR